MTTRITIRAELATLLAKAQATTDANRQAQRQREEDKKADRKRLEAKKAKEEEAKKKALEDPVGRSIKTAAAGGKPDAQVGAFFFGSDADGGEGIATGLPFPNERQYKLKVRAANFTGEASIEFFVPEPPSLFPFSLGYFPALFIAFPIAGSLTFIVLVAYEPLPDNSVVNPVDVGFDLTIYYTRREFWFLVTETTVEAIAPLNFPIANRVRFQTIYDSEIVPPLDLPPESNYMSTSPNVFAEAPASLPPLLEGFVNGVFVPTSYGIRRLFQGEPFVNVSSFPGHANYSRVPIITRPRLKVPLNASLDPASYEGYNLYYVWDGGQPALCTDELAAMGYLPTP